MTVGELKEALKDYPDDMVLARGSFDWESDYESFGRDYLHCEQVQPCANGWILPQNVRKRDFDPQKLVNILVIV